MKHGRDCPSATCSQCLGLPARRVDQEGAMLKVDGVPARPIDVEASAASRYYGKRGKQASMRVTRKPQ